jgi:hypothetical protein
VDLKKEVTPKLYEELIGRMNAWNVDTDVSKEDAIGEEANGTETENREGTVAKQ